MPAIDSFGKTTAVVSMPCPSCGNTSLVRKFKASDSPIADWIACPVVSCSYEASFRDFRATISVEAPMTCPQCKYETMTLKTKDADSKYMGWVKCAKNGCSYEDSFEAFKAIQ